MDQSKIIAINKPKGYTVTRKDELNRKTVYDLLPDWLFNDNWMPIGRLDLDSKGLLLFTQNGQINNYLTTPNNCFKIYEIVVRGIVNQVHIEQILNGVETPDGLLKAVNVEVLGVFGPKTKLLITLDEGKNRHIRKLFGTLKDLKFNTSLKVLDLKRVQISSLKLDLESGKWRFLTKLEQNNILENMREK